MTATHNYILLTKEGTIRKGAFTGDMRDWMGEIYKMLDCDYFDSQTVGGCDIDHISLYFDDNGVFTQPINPRASNFAKALYKDSGLENPFAHGVYGAMLIIHNRINEHGEGTSEDNKALPCDSVSSLIKSIREYHLTPDTYKKSRESFMELFEFHKNNCKVVNCNEDFFNDMLKK